MDTALLVPALVAAAPASTRQYPLTIALELADSQLFLGFMNGTVTSHLFWGDVPDLHAELIFCILHFCVRKNLAELDAA